MPNELNANVNIVKCAKSTIMKTYLKVSTYRLLLILLLRLHVIVLSLLIPIIIRYDY